MKRLLATLALTGALFAAAPAAAQPVHTSPAGVQFIADFEGFYPGTYNDPVGYCTAYYGHLIAYRNCTAADRAKYPRKTPKQALSYLVADLHPYEAAVLRAVKVPITQHEFDALSSFQFNTGSLAGSTLLAKLNRGEYREVIPEFAKWVHAGGRTLPGLVRRRGAEALTFQAYVSALTDREIHYVALRPSKAAIAWLRADAKTIQTRARAEKNGWKVARRGARFQQIEHCLPGG